jgi:hypothetical protein
VCRYTAKAPGLRKHGTRAQQEAFVLASCHFNLLLRGPAKTGKRWFTNYWAQMIKSCYPKLVVKEIHLPFKMDTYQLVMDMEQIALQLGTADIAIVLDPIPSNESHSIKCLEQLDMFCKTVRALAKKDPPSHMESFGGLQMIFIEDDQTANLVTKSTPHPDIHVVLFG